MVAEQLRSGCVGFTPRSRKLSTKRLRVCRSAFSPSHASTHTAKISNDEQAVYAAQLCLLILRPHRSMCRSQNPGHQPSANASGTNADVPAVPEQDVIGYVNQISG